MGANLKIKGKPEWEREQIQKERIELELYGLKITKIIRDDEGWLNIYHTHHILSKKEMQFLICLINKT